MLSQFFEDFSIFLSNIVFIIELILIANNIGVVGYEGFLQPIERNLQHNFINTPHDNEEQIKKV